ncbi:MAG: DMT family transporter [Paracoccaceae bacterium]
MRAPIKGALVALAAFAVFGTHDALIKVLGGTYTSFQIIFFAVLFSFPLTTLMLVQDSTSDTLFPHRPGWMFLRTGAVVIGGICAFYAFSALPLAQVYAILFSVPLLITALSVPLLGEIVRLRRWIAVAFGLVGVLIVLRLDTVELTTGHAAALLAACAAALSSVIVRKIGQEERPVVLLIYPMLGQFGLMACVMPWVYVPMQAGDLAMVALVAVLGHIAMRMMITAYRTAEASIVAPMQYSQILWATLFGILLFDEWPNWNTAVGAIIIIGSGLYILFRESSGPSENQPVTKTRSRVVPGTHPRIGPAMDAETRQREGNPEQD